MEVIQEKLRQVPNFPKAGITFYDITPVLQDPIAFGATIEALAEPFHRKKIEAVIGMESRGFIFGAAIANDLGAGFVPVRKTGKLPWETIREEYELEYGMDAIEIHKDAVEPGQRVLIVDDLLATGGTARATINLLKKLDAQIVGCSFMIELKELKGRERLHGVETRALISL